jgi:hypothetical protein
LTLSHPIAIAVPIEGREEMSRFSIDFTQDLKDNGQAFLPWRERRIVEISASCRKAAKFFMSSFFVDILEELK